MAEVIHGVTEALRMGQTLAVADQVLIDPKPGMLVHRVEALLVAIREKRNFEKQSFRALIQLGMNFVGRDAEIVGYNVDEIEAALKRVLTALQECKGSSALRQSVQEFLLDMKSVNLADSLPGILAERIEAELDNENIGFSFLQLLKAHMRSGVYWRMIGENYCKFGNDFARGLEYLRHFGFCQVSTNPVLAAKAFDEDPLLTQELKLEIDKHRDWKENPEEYADEIAMAATLIALWPNLAIFRPLALHTCLKDYMVSFQLNPNIADQVGASIEDAKNAYTLAGNFLTKYDSLLGLEDRSGETDPNIVFKVAASHEAARNITTKLNALGMGTNNTVVYTVGQEVQLILDAFKGKAEASLNGRGVVRTYETNMGGRFVSHLREVEAEKIFDTVVKKTGEEKAIEILESLASNLGVDDETLKKFSGASLTEKIQEVCTYKFLKSLDQTDILQAVEVSGQSQDAVKTLEDDLQKAGTLVARRVFWVFFSPENRTKWVRYLMTAYGVNEDQSTWILNSMDVLPASKRIPDDSYHTLGNSNMCNTEFPNHARAVELASEKQEFNLEDFRDSILDSYDLVIVQRLRELPDFCRGYDVTLEMRNFLQNEVRIDVGEWHLRGLESEDWPNFGSVQKTISEFQEAYDAFATKCVDIAREVAIE